MTISSVEFDYIRNLVRDRTGIVLEPGKEYLVESRLDPLARQAGFPSLQHLLARLRTDPLNSLHHRVVQALTTNETTFFRDIRTFEVLKAFVFPEILTKRAAERCVNLWCAACSSGQEPYSIAMLLRESFPFVLGWNTRLIASDISTEMLQRARQGRYTQLEIGRGLPAALLAKYFEKRRNEWQIAEDIRRMVEFRQINLAEAWPLLPTMDIIFVRNVLIYFDVEAKRDILSRARRLLRPDGYVFLGSSETTINLDESFEPVSLDRTTCYRLKGS